MEHIECLIIGSGPAGYTAAIYTCRADVKTVVYEGMQPGGQLTQTTEIENFPGYPKGINGPDMMEDIRQQALRFGAEIREGEVTGIDVSQRPFKVTTEYDGELLADSIIVSTGAAARYLGLPTEEEFKGGGVSACATCDGFFYKGKDVAVVGGGDTACEDATYLAKLCNKVYLIVRRDVLRASKAMQHRVLNTPNIEVLWKHQTKELFGEQQGFMKKLKGAVLYHSDTKEERTIYVDGFFEAIGHTPNTKWMRKATSSPSPSRRPPMWRASSLAATVRTASIVRPLWQPVRVPWQASRWRDIWRSTNDSSDRNKDSTFGANHRLWRRFAFLGFLLCR